MSDARLFQKPLSPALKPQDFDSPRKVADAYNRLIRRLEETRREEFGVVERLDTSVASIQEELAAEVEAVETDTTPGGMHTHAQSRRMPFGFHLQRGGANFLAWGGFTFAAAGGSVTTNHNPELVGGRMSCINERTTGTTGNAAVYANMGQPLHLASDPVFEGWVDLPSLIGIKFGFGFTVGGNGWQTFAAGNWSGDFDEYGQRMAAFGIENGNLYARICSVAGAFTDPDLEQSVLIGAASTGWQHFRVAVEGGGTSVEFFRNGTLVATLSKSTALPYSPVVLGYSLAGGWALSNGATGVAKTIRYSGFGGEIY